jgi:UDP-2,3-diacylglucosamine pyrophosphatase LpxH
MPRRAAEVPTGAGYAGVSGGDRGEAGVTEEWVLVSDVHLNEVIKPEFEGWWQYKTVESLQDEDLAAFLVAIDARRPDHFQRSVLVFNGDTFDFDTCFTAPEGRVIPPEGLPPTVDGSVYKMSKILSDHRVFVAALAGFLAKGNKAIFVLGNHDRELHFPEVQEVLRAALAHAAPPGQGAEVAPRVGFEPWFIHVPGVLYAEHGNQYDATCSYRDVLDPSVPADREHALELETPFGSLLGRHTLCRLGTFNPYNDESFILSLGGYYEHWRRFYFPRRPFFRAYFAATWKGIRELRDRRNRQIKRYGEAAPRPVADSPAYRAYAEKKRVDSSFIERQLRLSSTPIVDRLRLLFHEVWLDRFGFLALALTLLLIGVFLVKTWSQALLLVLFVPGIVWVLRAMGRGSLALQERARWGLVAESIAEALDVPVVAFGHSHRPERRPLTHGGRYYNLGSWAPVLPSDRGSALAKARRYLVVRPAAGGRVHVVFARWGSVEQSD